MIDQYLNIDDDNELVKDWKEDVISHLKKKCYSSRDKQQYIKEKSKSLIKKFIPRTLRSIIWPIVFNF